MKKLLFLFILLTQVAAAQSPVYKDTTSGKYGVVIPPVMESMYDFMDYYEVFNRLSKFVTAQSPVYKDSTSEKFGVVHPITAEPITEFEYDWAAPVYLNDTLVWVRKAGLTGIISVNGRVVVPVEFDNIQDVLAGAEYGIVSVAKGGLWGLWDAKKGHSVLPLEFEYVRAIYPDLLVGRRKGSSFLEFFDENAQKLFERVGSAAGPIYAPNLVQIMNKDGELQYTDKNGNIMCPTSWPNAQWTDGKRVIALCSNVLGMEMNMLVSTSGDTILPPNFWSFTPLKEGRFIVSVTGRRNKAGLFDANSRQWLIPWSEISLLQVGEFGDPEALIFAFKWNAREGHSLYDASGNVLEVNCIISRFPFEYTKAQAGLDYHPYRYVLFHLPGRSAAQGLYNAAGRVILPMEYEQFFYFSEKHPVIATRSEECLDYAFDPKTGKKYFEQGFEQLNFTMDPNRFWAQKGGSWGLIETSREEKAVFEYDRVDRLSNLCFAARKAGQWYCFDADGRLVAHRSFDWICSPDVEHYRTFKASQAAKGKLLAYTGDLSRSDGWYAITDRRQAIFIKSAAKRSKPETRH
ncbi:MAG TPA: WG repeat-containing protein [Saprospiraceae bacterium]|nr:WG repeat-containing protein [Saprospiraceae bacterium]